MMKQFPSILIMIALLGILASCQPDPYDLKGKRTTVIFDTDIGGDIDDALALAMLYHYMDMGWIDMIAVMSCKDNPYSARYIDIMNHWYGYPDIPIGIVVDGAKRNHADYAAHVVDLEISGEPVFPRGLKEGQAPPVAVDLYRKLLSESPGSSVVIIAVGQSTNIARLLDSKPDEYSSLSGRELVARKVDYLSMMAGNFRESLPEANVFNDSAAAAKVFADWPTEIWISPFDVGLACPYPGESIENDFKDEGFHPLVEAYKSFLPMPYDRPTWDLTSVLYAAEQDSAYFTISPPGKVTLGYEPAHPQHVVTHFAPDPKGKHRYFSIDEQQARRIRKRLVEMVTMESPNK
jgi:inosine-uridine nucleoside N-ribohydrolase